MSAPTENPPGSRIHGLPRRVARRIKVPTDAYLARRRARRATRGSTVIVGPWCSEVGFELLYWIPYVRQLLREGGMTPDRVVVVSRGGVSDWYGGLASRYVDLLDWLSAEQFLEEQLHRIEEFGTEKQMSVTAFDREAVAQVRERLEVPEARVLHPSTMYRRYRPVWMRRLDPLVVEQEVDYSPITASPTPPTDLAEGEYIAVNAYFSGCFPDTPENRAALQGLLERLAQHAPVVLLGSGGVIDDHERPELSRIDAVAPGAVSETPRTNLAEQTRIVRGARLLVATYGGFSYLGPFLGVPTCAFYSLNTFNRVHLELLRRAERSLDAGGGDHRSPPGYLLFDLHHLSLIDQLGGERAEARAHP